MRAADPLELALFSGSVSLVDRGYLRVACKVDHFCCCCPAKH